MFGECHMHMFMDGVDYKKAVMLHKKEVQDDDIHRKLKTYRDMGITFIRDGGDVLGVSKRAAQLAPEYGITYRTPGFAIHKNGHYGGIVGYGFDTWKEYHELVKRVRAEGGDFIKIMISGIMDFAGEGGVTEEPLPAEDIREMIHIAHEEGFSVMAHTNGSQAIRDAVAAGVDSIEHGNYQDKESIQALADSDTVWVPTLVTVRNLAGKGRFSEEEVAKIAATQTEAVQMAYEAGVKIATGTDGGAWMVPHGETLVQEYHEFYQILGKSEEVTAYLEKGNQEIIRRF